MALEWLVIRLESLMGIGAGACIGTSGELQVLKLLRDSGTGALTILDVGANVGDFTHAALNMLGDRSLQIHAFEPGRVPFATMAARLREHANIHLNNVGLSSRDGVGVLNYDREGSGAASLTRRDCRHLGNEQTKSEEVTLTTLGRYWSQHSDRFIDLIKMDVEGHELEVLRGGEEIFAAGKVGMCLFEFGGCNIDTRTFFRDFHYFFVEREYDIWRVTSAPSLVRMSGYNEFHEQFRTTNFLAIRRGNGIRKLIP